MKTTALFLIASVATTAFADQYVQGYMRSDGTYVAPHYQTSADRNPYNNYSTQGNVNPYTGQAGYRDPVQVQQQYSPNYGGTHNPSQYNSSYGGQQRRGW